MDCLLEKVALFMLVILFSEVLIFLIPERGRHLFFFCLFFFVEKQF